MRWVLIAALLSFGCARKQGGETPSNAGKPPREAMVGKWTVDPSRLAEQPHMREIPTDKRALAVEMAKGMLRSMTVEFTPERYSITVGGATNTGTYSVKSEDGSTLTLATKGDDGEATVMVLTVQGEGLVLEPAPDEHTIPLARK
jgi:hypothetical protein